MRLPALLAFTGLLAACGGASTGAALEQPPASDAAPARGAAVAQGEPNKADAEPAFAGQTRAPESKSNVTLTVETIADGIDNRHRSRTDRPHRNATGLFVEREDRPDRR